MALILGLLLILGSVTAYITAYLVVAERIAKRELVICIYHSKWQASLFVPARKLESWMFGRPVECIVLDDLNNQLVPPLIGY